jgi:hypothetical protein
MAKTKENKYEKMLSDARSSKLMIEGWDYSALNDDGKTMTITNLVLVPSIELPIIERIVCKKATVILGGPKIVDVDPTKRRKQVWR